MIKLCIADDEEDFRCGMRDCIDWPGIGVDVVGTAADGQRTYDMILEKKPDIVLIDIQMPGMSGLQVIERVMQRGGAVPMFVILSGYDEFTYAQRAIRLQVNDYLLKPCSPDDVRQVVRKCAYEIEALRQMSLREGQDTFLQFYSRYVERIKRFSNESAMHYPDGGERAVLNMLLTGTIDETMTALEAFFDEAVAANETRTLVINCCVLLYMRMYRMLAERGKAFCFSTDATIAWQNGADDVLGTLWRSLSSAAAQAHERLNPKREAGGYVSKAVRYIEENYRADLSLDTVSRAVFVTPTYLSGMFKQYIGVNFVDYVQRVRIEKAKALLALGCYRTFEVSEAVGFANEKYFSQVFKKLTGLNPSQYRDAGQSGGHFAAPKNPRNPEESTCQSAECMLK